MEIKTKKPTPVRNKHNMVDAYYETVKEMTPAEIEIRMAKATSQENKIMQLFKKLKIPLTVSDIWQKLDPDHKSPKTSWGRATTNLKTLGVLQILPIRKIGYYGHNEHFYKLK